jgi:serine/threonine protein kinase
VSAEYIRLCPTCGNENTPEVMRCRCGALLAGLDLIARVALPVTPAGNTPPGVPGNAAAAAANPETAAAPTIGPTTTDATTVAPDDEASETTCPHADCAQPNPPGSTRCLYCDRPMAGSEDGLSGPAPGIPALVSLPSALRERFRIERALPATGAEAELLIVAPLAGGPELVAKIYRHGIHPDRDVIARLARIAPAHRVEMIESGLSDGFTYELMEYCRPGSLRDLLRSATPTPARLREIIAELAAAIAGVHEAGLIHRDLKPENVLIRSLEPLDLILTDFGIASLQNATLRFTGVARTLAYGAPETLSGVINGKADWWSLGMMMLEAARGSHPFTGLSDAVILHHLTTRPIDLAAVNDPKLRKLLRGLLLRDPKARWGSTEVTRWLADDPQLADPAVEELPVSGRRPYQIGKEECFSVDQLAVALARNWPQALSDLDNGLLMNWFRTELKDQNLVRFLIDLNMERTLHVDIRLLRLIIDLAPGIPPVWRGESLSLRSLLMRADQALKSDAEAAQWLDTLYEFRVLDAYAAAGNSEMSDIVRRWQGALSEFNSAWNEAIDLIKAGARPGSASSFDEAMYGTSTPLRPSPRQLHARLLAVAYDEGWAARLRRHLAQEVARLSVHSPWLQRLGHLDSLGPAQLLAVESLLPEARKHADRAEAQARQADADALAQTRQLQADTTMAIGEMRQSASITFFTNDSCAELRHAIERFSGLAAQVRALGRTDPAHQNLRLQIARLEPIASRMSRLIDTLVERRAENRGWFSRQTLGFFWLALILVPLIINEGLFYPLLVSGAVFAAWRLLPNFFTLREIKALAAKIKGG